MKPFSAMLVLLCAIVFSSRAGAVCLDPKTFVSGYQVPFDEELESSEIVATGKVTALEELKEDLSDPESVTAYIYTFEISRQLKGNALQTVRLLASNDSGGYRMAIDEEHILFMKREGDYFVAGSCGSSSRLPEGTGVVVQLEQALRINESAL